MMDINSLFPSHYLKAADLQRQARRVVIESCVPEQLGQGEIKPALQFRGVPKKLILNKTNGLLIAASFGTETLGWAGREIELYPENVMFQGQVVPAIRVRVPIGAAAAPATMMAADPFAHAAPAPAPQPPAPAAPQSPLAAPPSIPAAVQQPPAVTPPAAAEPAPAAPQQAEQAPAVAAQRPPPEQAATPAQAELPINW